jgi:hypothetical protein
MLGLMHLNTFSFDHIFYSQTRTWMAVVMGAAMAVVTLGYTWSMYSSMRVNVGIVAASAIIFAGAL